MNLSVTKSIILSTLLTLSIGTQASDILDISENYSSQYLRHMGEHISDVHEVSELDLHLRTANAEVSRLLSKKSALESELNSAQSKKLGLQSQRSALQDEIENTQMRIEFLLEEFYPQYSSVAALKQGIARERKQLVDALEYVKTQIEDRSAPFQKRIDILTSENNNNQQLLRSVISGKNSNSSKLSSALRDKKSLESKIAALRRQMSNRAQLNAQVAKSKTEYEKAKDKKGDRKCILGGLFSSKCRAYLKAKEAYEEIKDIQSGKTLASKQNDLKQKNTQITGNEQQLARAVARERSLNASIKSNQQEIASQETLISRVTASLRPQLIMRRNDLNAFDASLGNAKRIYSYQDEIANKRGSLSRVNNQITTLNQRIPLLPSEINAVASQIEVKKAQSASAQAEFSFAQSQIEKRKEDLLISESNLKVALLNNGQVAVGMDKTSFEQRSIYSNRDWSFSKSEGSVFDQGSTTCVAQTKALGDKGNEAALSIGKVLVSHESSEPTVFIKLTTDKIDQEFTSAKVMTVSAPNSSKSFKLNLVPNLSNSDELIFMVELEQREELIKVILAEYSVQASLNYSEDNFTFSLLGSTKTIKSDQSSLASQCEGIDIVD